ncbi:MAG: methyl-accepting chemotaxis protein [Pseudomonadales bacterium]|nr:methyl-accepting chemotaxis protein [Pseudomonadales bacterium]
MSIRQITQRTSGNRTILLPIVVLVISLVLLATNTLVVKQQDSSYQATFRSASSLEGLSRKLAHSTNQAAAGISSEFNLIRQQQDSIDENVAYLADSGNFPTFVSEPSELDGLTEKWQAIRTHTEAILSNQTAIVSYGESAAQIQALANQIYSLSTDTSQLLLKAGANSRQVMIANQQILLVERLLYMSSNTTKNSHRSAKGLESSVKQFSINQKALLSGNVDLAIKAIKNPAIIEKLKTISKIHQKIVQILPPLKQSTPIMNTITEAANHINEGSEQLLSDASSLVTYIDESQRESFVLSITGFLFTFLSLISIIWIGLVIYRETNRQLAVTEEENKHNQKAILTLLDELGNLADGDLTTYVTVTEDFTGAIADSINYTIDQLRILVSSINETSVRVSSSAENTQGTASSLAKASLQQAKEISGATNAVNEMVSSIEQVSRNASESSTTAEQFLHIANTGADVVDNTLRGMDTIREQIQDTSKRIKRLSESSQEIGDIVSLIDDIADQTNILALNAAIQASMAGDAGRGFAVVADEVQRLAERSSAATKQIEALVKTIQSDTNEAGLSMEKTTTEVVNGARLAKEAASALGDIEKVSNSLATLIDNISGESKQQLSSVEGIAKTMNIIQEITTQTLDGSQATSKSIGNLTSMSAELRETVAGFRLPNVAPSGLRKSDSTLQQESH